MKTPQLCLITDPDIPDLVEKVDAALVGGITMLQLRGHQCPAAHLYKLAQELRPRCQRHDAAFIVNDRLDVGLTVKADGFQLGARSLPLNAARRLVGENYLLGASVHSLPEAREAVRQGADFLLAGTIFASHSHPQGPTSGPSLLSEIKQALPAYPLLAVGGINLTNAGQTLAAGADGIAVISAILDAENILRAVRELRRLLGLP